MAFIPHLYVDFTSLNKIIENIHPWYVRTRVSVSEFDPVKNIDKVMSL